MCWRLRLLVYIFAGQETRFHATATAAAVGAHRRRCCESEAAGVGSSLPATAWMGGDNAAAWLLCGFRSNTSLQRIEVGG